MIVSAMKRELCRGIPTYIYICVCVFKNPLGRKTAKCDDEYNII